MTKCHTTDKTLGTASRKSSSDKQLHSAQRPSWYKSVARVKRRSRTLNACEPCKRRKTKCSGRPGPCVACQKAEYTCHFNVKHDPTRKVPIIPTTQNGELYLLNGVLQALKYGAQTPLMHFIQTLRHNGSPQELVDSLRPNLELLQEHGVIARIKIEDKDLMSLAEKSCSDQLTWGVDIESSMLVPGQTLPSRSEHGRLMWLDTSTPSDASSSSSSQMAYDGYSDVPWVRGCPSDGSQSATAVSNLSPQHTAAHHFPMATPTVSTHGNNPAANPLFLSMDEYSAQINIPTSVPEHPSLVYARDQALQSAINSPVSSISPQQWHHHPLTPVWDIQQHATRHLGTLEVTTAPEPWLATMSHPQQHQGHYYGYQHPEQAVYHSDAVSAYQPQYHVYVQ